MLGFVTSFCLNCKVAISGNRQLSISNVNYPGDFIRTCNKCNVIILCEEVMLDNVANFKIKTDKLDLKKVEKIDIKGNSHVMITAESIEINPFIQINIEEGSSFERN